MASNLKNLNELILHGNQIKDLTALEALKYLENLDIAGQEIKLDPIYVQPGGTVVIDNPLVGEWWNMKDIWDETTIYHIGFRVENGYYDAENNQFVTLPVSVQKSLNRRTHFGIINKLMR